MIVKSELQKLGLKHLVVGLGEVELKEPISDEKRELLKLALLHSGLVLMDDKKAILIDRIKQTIIEMVHYANEMPKISSSEYLSGKLNYNYTYLANLFSEVTGTTIEHFIISHKIEKVKELLLYDELTLTQISYQLNYSSVAHLSNQFKKVTGLTPTFFKNLKDKKRVTLDKV